jgi:nucleoside phosphorylase
VPLNQFGDYILLTNFDHYVNLFAQWHRVPVVGRDKPMPSATAGHITIINFGMGSATAATVMDLLSAIMPKAVLFLGKCGGVKHRASLGDLILPIAAIRGEGAATRRLSIGFPTTFIGEANTPESAAYTKMVEAASKLPALRAAIEAMQEELSAWRRGGPSYGTMGTPAEKGSP